MQYLIINQRIYFRRRDDHRSSSPLGVNATSRDTERTTIGRPYTKPYRLIIFRGGVFMESPRRKMIRLVDYDYSTSGAYFITICTKNRQNLFWDFAVGTTIGRLPLSVYGSIVESALTNVGVYYPTASIPNYVIMPNHIHLIILLAGDDGRPLVVPTIGRIIAQMKGYVSKQVGYPLWQSRFYEHIIRNEQDYLDVWQYIDANPAKWLEDEYYT